MEMRDIRLREGPVVTGIVLTVFTRAAQAIRVTTLQPPRLEGQGHSFWQTAR
jgi:hypothetical protein